MLPFNLSQSNQVCQELLKQNFGEIVGKVGSHLLRRGNRPLRDIISATGLNDKEVKKALAILVQHNFVHFTASELNKNIAEYSIIPENVYCLLRHPKYLFMMKTAFGDEAEMILEELLNQGQDSASNLIFRAAKRLIEANENENQTSVSPLLLYEKFQNLVINQYIVRSPKLASDDPEVVPTFVTEEKFQFSAPPLDLSIISQKLQENAGILTEYSDFHIIWQVNFERFAIEMRKEILVNAAARRVDPHAGLLYNLLFDLWRDCSAPICTVSNALSLNQIRDAARKKFGDGPEVIYCDQYLKILSEDSSELVTKVGDAGGGQYVLNYKNVFHSLACATLDSVALEKFGSRATRLFRLIRSKKYLEQDELQRLSMIPAKDAKMYTYNLVEHNFVQLRELKKGTSNGGPVKCFFLFLVDTPQVVRTVLDLCYKGLHNALVRKEFEQVENKLLLDKEQKVETMIAVYKDQIAEEELNDMKNLITPAEQDVLKRVHAMADQLIQGQIQVDETILILDSYLKYSMMK